MHAKGRKLLRTLKDSGLLASLIRTLTASSLSILLQDTVVYTWEQDDSLDPATPTPFLTSGSLSLVYQTDQQVPQDILNLCQTVLAALDHHTTLQYELIKICQKSLYMRKILICYFHCYRSLHIDHL